MARHKGGRKRAYKGKGRKSASKQYKEWYRSQLEAGLAPSGHGKMEPVSNLSSNNIKHQYQTQFGGQYQSDLLNSRRNKEFPNFYFRGESLKIKDNPMEPLTISFLAYLCVKIYNISKGG